MALWALLMLAEVLHGTARVLLLAPLVGDFRARQLAVFTGSLLFLLIAYLVLPWVRPLRGELFPLGLLWVACTLGFELILGRFAFGLTWERLLSDYALWRGGLMPIGLLVLGLAPWIVYRASPDRFEEGSYPSSPSTL